MITIFVGPRGQGKTLLMSKRIFRRYLQGYRILTNYGVSYPHGTINADALVKMNEDLRDCAMGIDEIHVLIDSRNSMDKRNKMISYFILQTRKRNVVLFGTTQHESQIDVRLRRSVDYWVKCKRIRKGRKKTNWFAYKVIDGLTGKVVREFKLFGPRWYHLFNTEETITDFA